ncbi:hypothetical protein Belba_2381 [Belliella baltica DSM 15883]|uniref:Uncharacterized protein n=1 Tax=Belliella baltica (strain DSM 15883 / CIP 108006 / LMG 21964 / BA134) TaxID=866536 RepID=I3Z6S3_BELBD|nr:hypothetical protein [Belliella baltica]AFL84941.1 hypothetical protein Belba_2381 [Belliella baltica DSM 15883]
MIDLGNFEACVCQRSGQPSESCADRLVLQEKGKKITLKPRSGESAKLLILDGCVLKDNSPKCDGVFFYEKRNTSYIILVELKGGDIDHAFEQIKYTREQRTEYTSLKNHFRQNRSGSIIESAFVISNHRIDRVTHQKLEKAHGLRLKAILHSEATTPLQDLRTWL